jgi:hypothetical protein
MVRIKALNNNWEVVLLQYDPDQGMATTGRSFSYNMIWIKA